MTIIRVEQLWRYPVKSLRGEALDAAHLTLDGVQGDRVVHVVHVVPAVAAVADASGANHPPGHPATSAAPLTVAAIRTAS